MPTTFANTIDGNEILAKRSQCDYAGNDIQQTYATKSEVTTGLFEAQYGITPFADIAAAITAKKVVYCKVSPQVGVAFLAYYDIYDYIEFQYYRSNSDASEADSVFVYDVTHDNVWTATERVAQKAADWDAAAGSFNSIANKPVPKTLTASTGISITENASTITIANTAPDTVASLPTNLTAAQIQAFKEALGVDETLLWSGVALDATMSELPTNFERIRIEFGTPVANTGDNIGRGCIEVSMAYVDTSNNGSIFLSTFFNGDGSNNNPYYTSGFVIGIRTLSWQTAWTAFGQVFGTTKSTGNSWFRLNKVVGIHRIASN